MTEPNSKTPIGFDSVLDGNVRMYYDLSAFSVTGTRTLGTFTVTLTSDTPELRHYTTIGQAVIDSFGSNKWRQWTAMELYSHLQPASANHSLLIN